MSSNGVPIQEISDTVGHKSTHVTETVYRHVIVPAIRGGATVMDDIFDDDDRRRRARAHSHLGHLDCHLKSNRGPESRWS